MPAHRAQHAVYLDSTDELCTAVQQQPDRRHHHDDDLDRHRHRRWRSRWRATASVLRGFYRGLMFLPMIMPDIVLGIAPADLLRHRSASSSGCLTIIIGHCTFLTSYVFIIVSGAPRRHGRALEEASADLGADALVTFRRIILPQLVPGIIGGALLAFIISMDDLVITYFIAGVDGTTLPVFIFSMLRARHKAGDQRHRDADCCSFSLLVASLGLYLRRRQSRRLP